MIRVPRLAVLAALVALAGCGGKKGNLDKVVARAGDIEVTLGQFHDVWSRISVPNRPDISTLETRRRFANDLINQRIMLAEARRIGGITDPKIADAIEQRRRSEMLGALYRAEVEEKVEISGADVEDLYQHRKTNVRASHILLLDGETAQRVHDDITAGRISFEDAAARYSIDQNTKDRGGSLGEIQWTQTLPEFQSRAFANEPGTLSEPFETTFGFHILRVDERVPKELPELEDARVTLRNEVRRQKERARLQEFSAELERKANLAWNDDGLRALSAAIERMAGTNQDTLPPEQQNVPQLTDEEKTMALATLSGRDWTLGDYVAGLQAQPAMMRPATQMPLSGLRELIRTTQIDPELALEEAKRRKLDEDPEIRAAVQRLEEQVLVETLHSRFIQTADVTPEEVRAYYDSTAAASPESMRMPERVDMVVLAAPSVEALKAAMARIRKGEDEAAVIGEVSIDPRTSGLGGRTGLIPRGNYAPNVEEIAFSGRQGKGWSDPIVTENGAVAIKVLEYQKARQATFEEVEPQLTRTFAQRHGEEAFEEWLRGERERRGVEIFDEALELYDQPGTGGGTPATPASSGAAGHGGGA